MAKAKNAVIAGDYVGKKVNLSFGRVQLDMGSVSYTHLRAHET